MSRLREPANAATHLLGVGLSLLGLLVLVWTGVRSGNVLALIGLSVYGLTQVALYSASTLFHGLRLSHAGTERLLQLDCVLVYVFIAGTYTPVCLIALQHGWRWGLLATVWGLSLGGLILRLRWPAAPVWLTTALYVAMGWVALAALPGLLQAVPHAGIAWFVAGGCIYTIGALIFAFDSPSLLPGIFEAHALWHLFVIGGSACCFWAIIAYVAPLA